MMERVPMTVQGAESLREELQHLKTVTRPTIIKAIAEAREHGDLSENAEYHAAREQQSFTEGRIADIEGKLSRAQIIDVSKIPNEGKVIFGCTVVLLNVAEEKEVTYQIVGDDESDLTQHKISYNSPIAKAIIAKSEGDEVVVMTPNGKVEFEIVTVKY